MGRAGLLMLGAGIALTACAPKAADNASADALAPQALADTLGSAEMHDADGKAYGTLYLTQAAGGVSISGSLTHFPPGEFGMHLHSVGLCEAPLFTTAGGHWNPEGHEHGTGNPKGAHRGDLPNVVAPEDSIARVQAMSMGGLFTGDSTALMDADGAAIVIHIAPDDYKTDPSGNSGERVVCGVIKAK